MSGAAGLHGLASLASTELDSQVSPGLLGFGVVAVLGVATYLLVKSMRSRISRIDLPEDRPVDPTEGTGREPQGSSGPSAGPGDEPDDPTTAGPVDR